ncbi:MAG: RecX family transcriptional regulator [Bacilli bacterium]|nr:MAG: RecX family transcriptional regulator [Bacilli bacterium]
MGYLDDRRFTEAYIKDKLNFTSWGDYKIINELNKLGISSLDIEDNIDLLNDDIFK